MNLNIYRYFKTAKIPRKTTHSSKLQNRSWGPFKIPTNSFKQDMFTCKVGILKLETESCDNLTTPLPCQALFEFPRKA